MKGSWLQLILYISHSIFLKKAAILKTAGVKVVRPIIQLVLLEIALAVVSVPIYLRVRSHVVHSYFSKVGAQESDFHDYTLRRVLTLSGLGLVALLWLIKLIFVIIAPTVFNAGEPFTVSNIRMEHVAPAIKENVSFALESAKRDESLTVPLVQSVRTTGRGRYLFSGVGTPGLTVVAYISGTESIVYSSVIKSDGTWSIEHDGGGFLLKKGTYSIVVSAYDESTSEKSYASVPYYFKVTPSWLDLFLSSVDTYANWVAACVVVVGIVVVIITA